MAYHWPKNPPPKPVIACTAEEGKTVQSEKDSTDINRIVKQYQQTGMLPQVRQGQFLDVTIVTDYREALEQVREADVLFNQLPAEVRREFDNDPATFLDAVVDPAQREKLERLKILVPVESGAEAGTDAAGDGGSSDG